MFNQKQASVFNVSILIASLLGLNLTACTKSNTTKSIHGIFADGIYSTRSTKKESQFIGIIKLKTPALLSTATQAEGKTILNAAQVNLLLAEQETLVKSLKMISSDIQVLMKYRLVLNAIVVLAPTDLYETLKSQHHISFMEKSGQFARPVALQNQSLLGSKISKVNGNLKEKNSVKFIQGEEAHQNGLTGKGIRIGVIDTGIDYTHSMLGGVGSEELYNSLDRVSSNSHFPNSKVVGGIDIVGTEFNSASEEFLNHIPHPDLNPLDEGGHGTHVAGTISGQGNGTNSYDGVAPDADLYAIKVFGKTGSTSDEAVIAALEFAADPHGDLSLKDQLDVVNMSLGSGYGNPHILYNEAITNLVKGGTIVVASGGNSGAKDYIVGAPGVSDDAISVAASIDNMDHNYKFNAVEFSSVSHQNLIEEMIEGTVSKPVAESTLKIGDLVYVGIADKDFSDDVKEKVKGRVALIDRGLVAFADKIRRAQDAGAIAVVVGNNQDGDAFVMGGDGKFDIPAIMITKKMTEIIKADLLKGEAVSINFASERKIEKTQNIDTITGFSSKGPRSGDGFLKPEIAAPGENIISASMGHGSLTEQMSGTSMAAPHIAGVMGLLKQAHPELSVYELKSILMGHGKRLVTSSGENDLLSHQGAGRVQIMDSVQSKILSHTTALSLGILNVESHKIVRKSFDLKNITKDKQVVLISFEGSVGLQFRFSQAMIEIPANSSLDLQTEIKINSNGIVGRSEEFDGFIVIKSVEGSLLHKIPVLAVVVKASRLKADSLITYANSPEDSFGSAVDLTLSNLSSNAGTAQVFNLIDLDGRKKDSTHDQYRNKACDLQSAGYRIIKRTVDGESKSFVQFALKLFNSMTTWNTCEANIQIKNDKGELVQELVSLPTSELKVPMKVPFASALIDARMARQLRSKFENDVKKDPKIKFDFSESILSLSSISANNNSAVAVIEADLSELHVLDDGALSIQISTTHSDSGVVEMDDYLNKNDKQAIRISLNEKDQGFYNIPESISLRGKEKRVIQLEKGTGIQQLLIYFPENSVLPDNLDSDSNAQGQLINNQFSTEKTISGK